MCSDLIKDYLFNELIITAIDKTIDGVMGLKLKKKSDNECIVRIYACYLSPEGSPWANAVNFSVIYKRKFTLQLSATIY